MQNQKLSQDMLDFNKNTVKMSYEMMSSFTDQTAKATDQLLGTAPYFPAEGKKAAGIFFKESQKGLTNMQSSLNMGLAIDWTAMNAPMKGIEAMESFYTSVCSQAEMMQKETKDLMKKTTEQFPKETLPMMDFWAVVVNSNVQLCQSMMTKNFELAKKVLAEVAAEVPKAAGCAK